MPYETVQYPRVASYDLESTTELAVHWTKDSHVQISVERHADLAALLPDSDSRDQPLTCHPAIEKPIDPIPVGSVKIPADGSQVALKTQAATSTPTGRTSADIPEWAATPAEWTVLRQCGSVEKCTDIAIQDWPIVAFGDGTSAPAAIITNVLDRNEINRLIRVLRKARDDAYGRDE